MMGLRFPKVAPGSPSRAEQKQAKRTAEAAAQQLCYRAVDLRDRRICRVCHKACDPHAIGILDRGHHHHLEYRSKGGDHETANVLLLCAKCHDAIHRADLRLSGDADQRDPISKKFTGVKCERLTETGWTTEKWC